MLTLNRRELLQGGLFLLAAGSAGLVLPASLRETLAESPLPVTRHVYDVSLSVAEGPELVPLQICRGPRDILLETRINHRARFRWVPCPSGEWVLQPGDSLWLRTEPGVVFDGGVVMDRGGKAFCVPFQQNRMQMSAAIPMEAP